MIELFHPTIASAFQIPVVSTISVIAILFFRTCVLPLTPQRTINRSVLFTSLQVLTIRRCAIAMIPLLGNLLCWISVRQQPFSVRQLLEGAGSAEVAFLVRLGSVVGNHHNVRALVEQCDFMNWDPHIWSLFNCCIRRHLACTLEPVRRLERHAELIRRVRDRIGLLPQQTDAYRLLVQEPFVEAVCQHRLILHEIVKNSFIPQLELEEHGAELL